LVGAGVLYSSGPHYRFRHNVISERLAREAAIELAERDALNQLTWPVSVCYLLDSWHQFRQAHRVSRLIDALIRTCPDEELAVGRWALYRYYGLQDPGSTTRFIRAFAHRFPHSPIRVYEAEILDGVGRFAEAEKVWRDVIAEHPHLTYRWARREGAFAGRTAGAIAELRRRVTETKDRSSAEPGFDALVLAELECRFGNGAESEHGLRVLRTIASGPDPGLVNRANLELARIGSEDAGDFEGAWNLLDGISEWSLKFARCAQLRAAGEDTKAAAQYGLEAYALAGWLHDPIHQIEVVLTAACTSSRVAQEASDRLNAMVEFGWRLPGRNFDVLAKLGENASAAVAKACGPPPIAVAGEQTIDESIAL